MLNSVLQQKTPQNNTLDRIPMFWSDEWNVMNNMNGGERSGKLHHSGSTQDVSFLSFMNKLSDNYLTLATGRARCY